MFYPNNNGSVGGGPAFQMEVNGTAVPEPSTWLQMLVGFGGLGSSLIAAERRSRPTAPDTIALFRRPVRCALALAAVDGILVATRHERHELDSSIRLKSHRLLGGLSRRPA
jgi:hypothetical protein